MYEGGTGALIGDQTLAQPTERFDVHTQQITQWKTHLVGELPTSLMDGTTNTANAVHGPYAGWQQLKLADVFTAPPDFNGDGKSDLAWQHTNGAVSLWLMNGTANIASQLFGPYTGWAPDIA